jgi:hypothetical protein
MAQQFSSTVTQKLPEACVIDITPPTFAGIATLTPELNGALSATWPAATDDLALPIAYEIYIQESSPSGLFTLPNLVLITRNLEAIIFADASNDLLNEGVLYYVGVKARDYAGNLSNNTNSLSAISNGVITASLAELIRMFRGIAANQACDLLSQLEPIEVKSDLESNELISKVEIELDIKEC